MSIAIRTETPADAAGIAKLVTASFLTAEHADGNEAALVAALRATPDYDPRLALVAEEAGELTGFAMMTKGAVPIASGGTLPILVLAPVAVRPDRQRRGVGTRLCEALLEAGKKVGYTGAVVLGDPAYYGRFGFVEAERFGLRFPFDVPSCYALALTWREDEWKDASGTVTFSRAFFPEET